MTIDPTGFQAFLNDSRLVGDMPEAVPLAPLLAVQLVKSGRASDVAQGLALVAEVEAVLDQVDNQYRGIVAATLDHTTAGSVLAVGSSLLKQVERHYGAAAIVGTDPMELGRLVDGHLMGMAQHAIDGLTAVTASVDQHAGEPWLEAALSGDPRRIALATACWLLQDRARDTLQAATIAARAVFLLCACHRKATDPGYAWSQFSVDILQHSGAIVATLIARKALPAGVMGATALVGAAVTVVLGPVAGPVTALVIQATVQAVPSHVAAALSHVATSIVRMTQAVTEQLRSWTRIFGG